MENIVMRSTEENRKQVSEFISEFFKLFSYYRVEVVFNNNEVYVSTEHDALSYRPIRIIKGRTFNDGMIIADLCISNPCDSHTLKFFSELLNLMNKYHVWFEYCEYDQKSISIDVNIICDIDNEYQINMNEWDKNHSKRILSIEFPNKNNGAYANIVYRTDEV